MRTKNININQLKEQLQGQTVVSIQPVPDSPLEKTEFIVAMAQAAEQAGAKALRIEGVANVAAVSRAVNLPIIAIVKRDLTDSPVRITPYLCDVASLAEAGATIIAFDATNRERPESRDVIAKAIQESGCFAMADCSNFEDGLWANEVGVDIIGSTLSGYVGGEEPTEPDLQLVKQFSQAGFFTMAEGRYNTPELAAQAIAHGAVAVTVGSALTRLEVMIDWFNSATQAAGER
ncbi:N-acetylmannosamine-6-phosphate 2-epimerase [Vibrio scophthalmi]|uniref:Putative N-acetylmannosamine-6-phosphate 2-epimerase n=2 Tax=Vibrio scophthalmi TaxID=45658 RepID=A0A1C7FH86_9VIBR|nr:MULTISPECIES: N-acetylmannosamine-6-phosphate 2-epimerase [Vibrio]ANU39077.1 N-acylglucosamine-6-phosphate 2-epimerase [Vibrio scophthalmi]EGU34412.1 N-acetylmannosamine-6-phosphate 2-epimerase [Vibrio sp. N418]EGU34532.1 N-acetylmannosamine-6-phosphate 2-epimerase [Vibrio scophthalmi LMG 19158]ODS05398.1 N-acylglucosamine-6-phosphate 2-epimerase [Vibrio scophthalmi]